MFTRSYQESPQISYARYGVLPVFLDAPAKLASQKGCHVLENADLLDNSD